jgi:hypothetical protein
MPWGEVDPGRAGGVTGGGLRGADAAGGGPLQPASTVSSRMRLRPLASAPGRPCVLERTRGSEPRHCRPILVARRAIETRAGAQDVARISISEVTAPTTHQASDHHLGSPGLPTRVVDHRGPRNGSAGPREQRSHRVRIAAASVRMSRAGGSLIAAVEGRDSDRRAPAACVAVHRRRRGAVEPVLPV